MTADGSVVAMSYTFDGSRIAFTTLVDTNGSIGASDTNGGSFSLVVNGDTFTAIDGSEVFVAERIAGIAGTLVGGWTLGNPTQPDNSVVLVFTSGGCFAQDGSGTGSSRDSIEIGTFTWDTTSGLRPRIQSSQSRSRAGRASGTTRPPATSSRTGRSRRHRAATWFA